MPDLPSLPLGLLAKEIELPNALGRIEEWSHTAGPYYIEVRDGRLKMSRSVEHRRQGPTMSRVAEDGRWHVFAFRVSPEAAYAFALGMYAAQQPKEEGTGAGSKRPA